MLEQESGDFLNFTFLFFYSFEFFEANKDFFVLKPNVELIALFIED